MLSVLSYAAGGADAYTDGPPTSSVDSSEKPSGSSGMKPALCFANGCPAADTGTISDAIRINAATHLPRLNCPSPRACAAPSSARERSCRGAS
jgi:hypothetical protein